MVKCNSISIDVVGLYTAIQQNCRALLDDVANNVIDEFGMYVYQDGAGRHEWRANAAQEFQKISETMTDDLIEVKVGLREGFDRDAYSNVYAAQVMVALFGNHPPIYTKPGQETFHDQMTWRGESEAESEYRMPQYEWGDPGAQNMLSNVMKNVKTFFKDGLKSILSDINFYDYVHVTAGG